MKVEIPFMPFEMERHSQPEAIAPNQARWLQRVECGDGRIRRGFGQVRMQTPASVSTINSALVIDHPQDLALYIIDGGTDGTIRVTPYDGTILGTGPLPESSQPEHFGGDKLGQPWIENFVEDGIIDAGDEDFGDDYS